VRNGPALTVCTALTLLAIGATGLASEALRDPTRPYTARQALAASAPRYKVNAIIVSDERRIAIINGKRIGVGGRVNGATVVSIAKRELTLDVDGQELTLRLNSGGSSQ